MSLENRPVARFHIRLREEFDDWAVLFDPDTGNHRVLNPIGVFVWKLMDGAHDVKDIVQEIRDSYANVPEEVDQHVTEFIEVLLENGYAQTNSEGTAAS